MPVPKTIPTLSSPCAIGLFLPPGAATPVRLHGAYINLEEIESILGHITSQPSPEKIFLPEIRKQAEGDSIDVDTPEIEKIFIFLVPAFLFWR